MEHDFPTRSRAYYQWSERYLGKYSIEPCFLRYSSGRTLVKPKAPNIAALKSAKEYYLRVPRDILFMETEHDDDAIAIGANGAGG